MESPCFDSMVPNGSNPYRVDKQECGYWYSHSVADPSIYLSQRSSAVFRWRLPLGTFRCYRSVSVPRRLFALLLLTAATVRAQQVFASRCAPCHGLEARGTAQGPGLANNPRVAAQSVEELRA